MRSFMEQRRHRRARRKVVPPRQTLILETRSSAAHARKLCTAGKMARIERRVTPYGDIEYGVTVAEDGTTRVERFECKDSKSISFNETRYPDGRTTIERVEHPTGDKDFDIVFLPDGSRIVGR